MFKLIVEHARRVPSLIPLFVVVGGTVTCSVLCLLRVGIYSPEYTLDRKKNPEPWNNVPPDYEYGFLSRRRGTEKLKREGPDF